MATAKRRSGGGKARGKSGGAGRTASAKKGSNGDRGAKRLRKASIDRLRRQLEEEREQLLRQVDELDAAAVVGMWRDGGNRDDAADVGSATSERESAQSLASNARRILQQIDDALRRMEAGTYGLCERCGKPIEPARLEVLPYATLCVADKQREQRAI